MSTDPLTILLCAALLTMSGVLPLRCGLGRLPCPAGYRFARTVVLSQRASLGIAALCTAMIAVTLLQTWNRELGDVGALSPYATLLVLVCTQMCWRTHARPERS